MTLYLTCRDEDGCTPLCHAIDGRSTELTKILLEAGAEKAATVSGTAWGGGGVKLYVIVREFKLCSIS